MDRNTQQSIIALEMMAFMSTVEDPEAVRQFGLSYTTWTRDREWEPMGAVWMQMTNDAEAYGYAKHVGF